MIDLTHYFTILGLHPDATLQEVEEAYKDLIVAMHPDRHQGERKTRFEEKAKRINDARDKINKHYQQWRAFRAQQKQAGSSGGQARADGRANGDGRWSDPAWAAQEQARRRAEDERRRREEEARSKDAERRREQEKFDQLHGQYAADQERRERDMKHRGEQSVQIAVASLAATLAFCLIAAIFTAAVSWRVEALNHEADEWPVSGKNKRFTERYNKYRDEAKTELAKTFGRTPTDQEVDSFRPPFSAPPSAQYVPPYELPPPLNPDGSNALTLPHWREMESRREVEKRKQQDQDVWSAKMEIDRHQKAIQQCESNIVEIDAQLANPDMGYFQRQKLIELRDFRQRTLDGEKAGLDSARTKLAQLECETVPEPPAPIPAKPNQGRHFGIPMVPVSSTNS